LSFPPFLPSYLALTGHVNVQLVEVRLPQPHGPPELGLEDREGVDDLGREGGKEGGSREVSKRRREGGKEGRKEGGREGGRRTSFSPGSRVTVVE